MRFEILVGGTGPTESIVAGAGRVVHLWRATTRYSYTFEASVPNQTLSLTVRSVEDDLKGQVQHGTSTPRG